MRHLSWGFGLALLSCAGLSNGCGGSGDSGSKSDNVTGACMAAPNCEVTSQSQAVREEMREAAKEERKAAHNQEARAARDRR